MGEDIRTYEQLLIERVNKMLTALDSESLTQFDRILENTEIMLKLKGPLYEQYQQWKTYFQQLLVQGYEKIKRDLQGFNEAYTREMYKNHNEAILEWGYRIDLLQKMVTLLNDWQLVPFGAPEFAEPVVEEPQQEVPVEQPPQEEPVQEEYQEPEQPPEPQVQAPPIRQPIRKPPMRQATPPGIPQDQIARLQQEEAEIERLKQQQPQQPQRRVFPRRQ